MIKFIKKILGKGIRLAYRLVYRLIPCNPKTVLFISFHGRGYSDNPKAIHQYMIQDEMCIRDRLYIYVSHFWYHTAFKAIKRGSFFIKIYWIYILNYLFNLIYQQ